MRGTEFRPIAASLKFSDPLRMSAAPSVKLSPEEKLEILRRLDEFHFWHSLGDRRMCRECGHSITGSEIQVVEGKDAREKMRLQFDNMVSDTKKNVKRAATGFGVCQEQRVVDHHQTKDLSLTYRGHVQTVRRAWHGYHEKAAVACPFGVAHASQRSFSFRAAVARLPMLRSVATGLHAFHPIA